MACFFVSLGAIVQLAAEGSIPQLTVGRLILGMGIGCISNAVPLYLSESSPAAIRGIVVGSWQLLLAIGQVSLYCKAMRSVLDVGFRSLAHALIKEHNPLNPPLHIVYQSVSIS